MDWRHYKGRLQKSNRPRSHRYQPANKEKRAAESLLESGIVWETHLIDNTEIDFYDGAMLNQDLCPSQEAL
jgi:hypothetical protein